MGTLASAATVEALHQEPKTTEISVSAAEAKAHLLRLLDEVARERKTVTITKRGRVVAQLVPPPETPKLSKFDQIFGRSRGKIKITGDIVNPDWEDWGPEWQ